MRGMATGNMGDLAPHPVNAALRLMGPIERVMAEVETVQKPDRVVRSPMTIMPKSCAGLRMA